jgi:glucose/arabinose dehydrogenase
LLAISNSYKYLVALVAALVFINPVTFADENHDWKSDWAVQDNFTISIDSDGYSFPTAIVFVPHPGTKPKDPLYFVTEIRGKVKVITNDRTVYTFAKDFFKLNPNQELPAFNGESGLAGICLDPEHGYVFVTFAYQDENNILRNNIIRFQSEPQTFSLTPTSQLIFTNIFSSEISSPSHQIGPCQVYNNMLYVSVGNAMMDSKSQDIDSLLGKVIRMNLDGKPVRSNPFYVDDDINKARNYVWAYGFRNPFGLKIVNGRVFVADNGEGLDRFLEVREGGNYLWDGNDWSIGTNANMVFAPSVGVVQLDYYPSNLDIFPKEYRGKFYLALCGNLSVPGPGVTGGKSIAVLNYSFDENKMLSRPYHFLKYRGSGEQLVVGVAIGPDGLYFVPIFPDKGGHSVVYKVKYERDSKYPFLISNENNALSEIQSFGCSGCHVINGMWGGTAGPKLDTENLAERIKQRLNSPEYVELVKKIDHMNTEPFVSFKDARKEVLEKKGQDKVKTWVVYHLMEPKFDNPYSQMPNLGLNRKQSEIIADYLLQKPKNTNRGTNEKLNKTIFPEPRYRYLIYSFVAGAFVFLLLERLLVYFLKRTR